MHSVYFNVSRFSARFCIRNLGDGLLVNLKNVDGHTTGGGELLVADMALEVLGFLVLHQDLLVIEFPVAIVTPYL